MIKIRFFILIVLSVALSSLPACKKKEDSIDVYSQLREVSRLELARMTIGKVGMISDPDYRDAGSLEAKAEAIFNSVKIGTRIGVYSYDTYLIAYVDLGKLTPEDIEIDEENRIARISLPPIEIRTDGREPQLHEEHYRVTGLRSSITPSERAALKSQMAKEVRRDMKSNSRIRDLLRNAAEAKGKAWLTELLQNWGYVAEINFK